MTASRPDDAWWRAWEQTDRPRLVRWLSRRYSDADAEDAVQTAALRIALLDDVRSPAAAIRVTATNLCRDRVRRAQRLERALARYPDSFGIQPPDTDPDSADLARVRLRPLLATLPVRSAALLVTYYREGGPAAAAAAGLRPASIGTTVHRLVERLRAVAA